MNLRTANLELVLQTPEESWAMIEGMAPSDRAELSADWLAQLEAAKESDPWVHGYSVKLSGPGKVGIGICGFKGPPSADGIVEIAYAIAPEYQCQGYATEAAQALVRFAFRQDAVRAVRAHTLPEPNASTRVLSKCGFHRTGEVMDPDDGLVWRWDRDRESCAKLEDHC